MPILDNILRYCEENKITIKEFERKCSISNSLVAKWRSGIAQPSLTTLQKIVLATGIELDEWLRDGGNDDSCRQDKGTI